MTNQDREVRLMTQLSEFFGTLLDLDEGIPYFTGPPYQCHMWQTPHGDLNRQTMKGWLRRSWIEDIRPPFNSSIKDVDLSEPRGHVHLTPEGREIVEAFAA